MGKGRDGLEQSREKTIQRPARTRTSTPEPTMCLAAIDAFMSRQGLRPRPDSEEPAIDQQACSYQEQQPRGGSDVNLFHESAPSNPETPYLAHDPL